MFTTPAATPVTRPVPFTVARLGSKLVQATARPVRTLEFPSSVVAVSCCVPPTPTVAVVGVTVTITTGTGITLTGARASLPPALAMTSVWPAATPVTTPLALTDAMADEPVVQVTVPVAMAVPNWSRAEALALAD